MISMQKFSGRCRIISAFVRLCFATACVVAGCVLLNRCGDPVIQDYIEAYSVQGFLIVGEPIRGVIVAQTGNIRDTFRLSDQIIRNADVRIRCGTSEFPLQFNPRTESYDYPDTTLTVLPDTVYSLVVRLSNGKEFTGQTRTPRQIRWVRPPRPILQYPLDTARLPSTADSLQVSWTQVNNFVEYIIGIRCLDTVGYGIHFPRYLNRPADTNQRNRRIERFFETQLPRYPDVARYGLRVGTSSAIVWTGFKWFGRNEIVLYAADANWLNWFKMVNFAGNPRYNPLLGSIRGEGGYGVFGSASVARQHVFLLKNQP
jgi:hypothetical protein